VNSVIQAPAALAPRERFLQCLLNRRLSSPQTRSGRGGEEKYSFRESNPSCMYLYFVEVDLTISPLPISIFLLQNQTFSNALRFQLPEAFVLPSESVITLRKSRKD
jgi:hypothetical protein